MTYVAPSTVVAGQTYSAAAHNVIVNDVIDLDSRLRVVTSSTRPGSPTEGMFIYETDTQKTLIYDGSSWVEVSDLDSTGGLNASVFTAMKNVQSTTLVTKPSVTGGSPVDMTGMSVAITPTFSTSKILVHVALHLGISAPSGGSLVRWVLVRNSTNIAIGDTTGNAYFSTTNTDMQFNGITHLDSPATTSSTTYKIQWFTSSASGVTGYLNRRGFDETTDMASSITAIEVLA